MGTYSQEPGRSQNGALRSLITRREVIRRSVFLGISVPIVASLISACADDDGDLDNDDSVPAQEQDPGDEVDSSDDDETQTTDDEPSADDRYGGSIRVGLSDEPAHLDPHTTTSPPAGEIRKTIYELLIDLDAELAPSPMLADSWEISDDGMTYTFDLREAAQFHNGQPFRSDDVKFSIERVLSISPRSEDYGEIGEIEEDGDHTVIFHLDHFSSSLIAKLTQSFVQIAPRDASEEDIEANGAITVPIGTGPFAYESHVADQEYVVRRFEDYVPRDEESSGNVGAKIAYLDQITFVPMVDDTVRLLALETGDIDHIDRFPPAEFERVEAEGEVVTSAEEGTDWDAIYFNFTRPPFDDLRMRQAVAFGVDWQALADAVYWGHGSVNNSFIPRRQQHWRTDFHDELHPYDPDRARELLEDYGYDGEPLEWQTRDNYRERTTAQVIQEMFREIGLNIEIRQMEPGAFLDGIYIRRQDQIPDWPFVGLTGSGFRSDPDQHYHQRVHSSAHVGMYDNSEYDEVVDSARSIADDDERRELYEQAQRIVMEDIPCIVMSNSPYLDAYNPRLQGMTAGDPLAPIYWNVWIEEDS
jgi:peptide/nickel transport system substrate-binding protein